MDDRELVLAGVDVPDLLARFMNNTKLMKMIVGKFLEDQTYQKLCDAIAQGDMQAAEFACHSLKGVCGNLSLTKLFQQLQEQLRLFRAGDHHQAVAMMDSIVPEFENTIAHLKIWLAQQ